MRVPPRQGGVETVDNSPGSPHVHEPLCVHRARRPSSRESLPRDRNGDTSRGDGADRPGQESLHTLSMQFTLMLVPSLPARKERRPACLPHPWFGVKHVMHWPACVHFTCTPCGTGAELAHAVPGIANATGGFHSHSDNLAKSGRRLALCASAWPLTAFTAPGAGGCCASADTSCPQGGGRPGDSPRTRRQHTKKKGGRGEEACSPMACPAATLQNYPRGRAAPLPRALAAQRPRAGAAHAQRRLLQSQQATVSHEMNHRGP